MSQHTPCVHKGYAGEGALRAPFEPPPRPSRGRPLQANDGPRRRRLDASEARSLHAGPRQRLRRPPLRSGPAGDADRRSGILAWYGRPETGRPRVRPGPEDRALMVRPVRPARRRTSPGHPSRVGAARTGRPRRRASSPQSARTAPQSRPCRRTRSSSKSSLPQGHAGRPLPSVVRPAADDPEHVVGIAQCDGAAVLRSGLAFPPRDNFAGSDPRNRRNAGTPIAPRNRRFRGGRSRHYGRGNTGPPASAVGGDRFRKRGVFRSGGPAGAT